MSGLRWIWGRRTVLEALQAGRVERVLVAHSIEPQFRRQVEMAARTANVEFEPVDQARIDRIVPSGKAQGIVAEVQELKLSTVDELLGTARVGQVPALFLVLEEIQDPRNLGSLLRSAEAAGCNGAMLTEHRSAPLSGAASKASAGALHHLPMARAGNMSHLLQSLKDEGIWSIGLDGDAKQTLFACDLKAPTAILVGGEGSGLRRLTAERVDILASIPMAGRIASLNASVAGAIALFEAVRQRTAIRGVEAAR